MAKRPLKAYEADAARIACRSHMLWKCVNTSIHRVIEKAIKNHKSRQWVHDRLMRIAGPKEKNEPVSLGNYRSAAKQIFEGEGELVLI